MNARIGKQDVQGKAKAAFDRRGASRLGWLLLILFIVSAVFAGSQIFPFYYYYYEIEGLMQSQAAKATVFSDAE
ncbi:MAG TPA: hypothetical protein PLP17_12255, partial [Oligoflexia bacterium]|nr:hypothetical protein [Oligoflexia bacterium]